MISAHNSNVNFGKFPKYLFLGITTKANNAMNDAIQTANTIQKNVVKEATSKVTSDFYTPAQRAQRFNPLSEFFEGISRIFG